MAGFANQPRRCKRTTSSLNTYNSQWDSLIPDGYPCPCQSGHPVFTPVGGGTSVWVTRVYRVVQNTPSDSLRTAGSCAFNGRRGLKAARLRN